MAQYNSSFAFLQSLSRNESAQPITSLHELRNLLEALKTEESPENRALLCDNLFAKISLSWHERENAELNTFSTQLSQLLSKLAEINAKLEDPHIIKTLDAENNPFNALLCRAERALFQLTWGSALDVAFQGGELRPILLLPIQYTDPNEMANTWVVFLSSLETYVTAVRIQINQIQTGAYPLGSTLDRDLLIEKINYLITLFSFLHDAARRRAISKEYKDAYNNVMEQRENVNTLHRKLFEEQQKTYRKRKISTLLQAPRDEPIND